MSKRCSRNWCLGEVGEDGNCDLCGHPFKESITYIQGWIRDLERELIMKCPSNQIDYHNMSWKIKVLKVAVGWWEDLEQCERDNEELNELLEQEKHRNARRLSNEQLSEDR